MSHCALFNHMPQWQNPSHVLSRPHDAITIIITSTDKWHQLQRDSGTGLNLKRAGAHGIEGVDEPNGESDWISVVSLGIDDAAGWVRVHLRSLGKLVDDAVRTKQHDTVENHHTAECPIL